MKKNGAFLLVHALEQIGVRKTFGIPGVHNTEIYNQLGNSKVLEPILVTHELSAGFMADAVSRTSDSIGAMVIVPGAGMTHSMSAIAEAAIDGIPMIVISGGIRREHGKSFPMHRLNMEKTLEDIIKKYYYLDSHCNIVQTIYDAYEVAVSEEPGPVFIEVPVETQLAEYDSDLLIPFKKKQKINPLQKQEGIGGGMQLFSAIESPEVKIEKAAALLLNSESPGIYVGWGSVDAYEEVKQIAEMLSIPVATTFQGVSAFPANHPLHTGIGFGVSSTPAGEKAFDKCDCLLAVGLKFSELATFNYHLEVPDNLIHIDINPDVFHKNYYAKVAIEGDSKLVLTEIIQKLKRNTIKPKNNFKDITELIKREKEEYKKTWLVNSSEETVSPGFFFNALRNGFPEDIIMVTDDGNHSLLALELFPVYMQRHFICPTDFNCLGYAIPAAIGAKMVNRQKTVIAIIGQSALLMTGLEMFTAHNNKTGIIVFVFKEYEQGKNQEHAEKKMVTTNSYGILSIKGLADAVHAEYLSMKNDVEISGIISKAREINKSGKSVLVEVNIDYSRKPKLALGMGKPKFSRFRLAEKLKMFFKGGN
ncbi:MAG: thiamine pyrophosphate-binding protein [Bacteroidales bacterium]